jgi:toxin ParE1/3/4
VAQLRFSRRAEADLLAMGRYTLRTWGEAQTVRYVDGLEACCQTLADHPELGRACDEIRSGLQRMEHGRHVVF